MINKFSGLDDKEGHKLKNQYGENPHVPNGIKIIK